VNYSDFFPLADDYIKYTDNYVITITDPSIKSRFTGFLSISAVTVFELAIKTIFIDFSAKKHKVFGAFVQKRFEKLNGRISLNDIRQHLSFFGEKYIKRFDRKLEKLEAEIIKTQKNSVKSSYGNILRWRNDFTHKGISPQNATYEEAKNSYERGKLVIKCLAESMNR
jgi:RiboL-PSP-HEPN